MVRRVFDGTGPYSGLAALCWLAGLAMFCAILMSPNGRQWWLDVHAVQGRETGGLVYYSVGGTNYTLDDPNAFAGSATRERTVYYLQSDPGGGALHNSANEILDWGLTAGPGALGVALLVTGFARRGRQRKRVAGDAPDAFGQGIPAETIQAIVRRNARAGPAPRP